MRNQQEIKRIFNKLHVLGVSYTKIGKDSGLPQGTILSIANKAVYEYQAEPQSLRKADDVINSYVKEMKEIIGGKQWLEAEF